MLPRRIAKSVPSRKRKSGSNFVTLLPAEDAQFPQAIALPRIESVVNDEKISRLNTTLNPRVLG